MSNQAKPAWSDAAQVVADALKQSAEQDIVQIIVSGLERYSIYKHGSAESRIVPLLSDLRKAIDGRMRSV